MSGFWLPVAGGGSGGAASGDHKQTVLAGAGNISGLTSTSFSSISASLGYLSLTLEIGDVVDVFFQSQGYVSSSANTAAFDVEVDQPTSANTYVSGGGDGGLVAQGVSGTRIILGVGGRFTASEAGSHGFRPVYKVAASSPGLVLTNATSGYDETPIIFAVRNLGPVTA